MKSGTATVAPVSSLAGLVTFVAVSPSKTGIGLDDLELDVGRQIDADRRSVVKLNVDDHSVLEKVGRPADDVALQRYVLKRLLIHEMEAVGVVIEHLHLAVVDRRALQLFAGAKRALQRRARLYVLHPRANERRTLSGLYVEELDDGPELPVDDDGDAVAKIV